MTEFPVLVMMLAIALMLKMLEAVEAALALLARTVAAERVATEVRAVKVPLPVLQHIMLAVGLAVAATTITVPVVSEAVEIVTRREILARPIRAAVEAALKVSIQQAVQAVPVW